MYEIDSDACLSLEAGMYSMSYRWKCVGVCFPLGWPMRGEG